MDTVATALRAKRKRTRIVRAWRQSVGALARRPTPGCRNAPQDVGKLLRVNAHRLCGAGGSAHDDPTGVSRFAPQVRAARARTSPPQSRGPWWAGRRFATPWPVEARLALRGRRRENTSITRRRKCRWPGVSAAGQHCDRRAQGRRADARLASLAIDRRGACRSGRGAGLTTEPMRARACALGGCRRRGSEALAPPASEWEHVGKPRPADGGPSEQRASVARARALSCPPLGVAVLCWAWVCVERMRALLTSLSTQSTHVVHESPWALVTHASSPQPSPCHRPD